MSGIGDIDLGEGLNGDFDRARRRALVRGVLARLRGDRTHRRLPSFDESGAAYGSRHRTEVGVQSVEVGRIVGSVGRARDFDRSFLPATPRVGERWKRVNRAFRRAERLPPVRLNKVGDAYFVVDGNHRVSVARFHGVGWIDADVTEFRPVRAPERTSDRREETA